MVATPQEQLAELRKGVVDLVSEPDLLKKLERSYKEKKPLIIKLGADPTRPDLHLGHTVVINKLKQFQDFGHSVKFLIGDFTSLIGDPSGKSETRPALTREEVAKNGATYARQIFKILDAEKTEIVYNSTWIDKLSPQEFIKLTAQQTVARMLERDDFEKRYKGGVPISIHEFIYPLMQGYDSVALVRMSNSAGPIKNSIFSSAETFSVLMAKNLSASSPRRSLKDSTASTRCRRALITTSASKTALARCSVKRCAFLTN